MSTPNQSATLPVAYTSGPPLALGVPFLFGQHWNTIKPACFPQAMDVLRIWDDSCRLALIAPAEGQFNWATLDLRVAAALAAGKKLIYVVGGSTPAWAAAPTTGPPGIIDPTSNRPANLQLIQPVIAALVARYKGKIWAYESWNEFNYPGFFCGTEQQLLLWQQMLYLEVKQGDPAALVTMPTPTWNPSGPLLTAEAGVKSLFGMGFQGWADVATFHGYLKPGLPGSTIGATIANIRAVMAAANCAFPLWDTEFGFSGSAGGADGLTPAVARQWVLDAFMAHLTGGVALAAWYGFDYLGPAGTALGGHNPCITDFTGTTLTPAGQAIVDLYAALKAV